MEEERLKTEHQLLAEKHSEKFGNLMPILGAIRSSDTALFGATERATRSLKELSDSLVMHTREDLYGNAILNKQGET